jgi:hypothetical protein
LARRAIPPGVSRAGSRRDDRHRREAHREAVPHRVESGADDLQYLRQLVRRKLGEGAGRGSGGLCRAGHSGVPLCDAGLAPCPAGAKYPKPNGTVVMKPLPSGLPTMPNACAGVPANPWCPAHHGGGGYVQPAAAAGSLALIAVPAVGWRMRRRPRISR